MLNQRRSSSRRSSKAAKRPRLPRPTKKATSPTPPEDECPICRGRGHGLHRDVSRMRALFSRGVPQGDDRVVMGRGQCLQANAPRDQLSCPMCRATTRVHDSTAFRVGETVDARCPGRFYAGTVDEVILDKANEVGAYEANWTEAPRTGSARPSSASMAPRPSGLHDLWPSLTCTRLCTRVRCSWQARRRPTPSLGARVAETPRLDLVRDGLGSPSHTSSSQPESPRLRLLRY